ncbi:MAG: helicase HerA domain-containing protein [Terriglobales bacterium]
MTSPTPAHRPSPLHAVEQVLTAHHQGAEGRAAQELLGSLVQRDQYVGEVYTLGYESALVIIHDSYRKRVGGIPSVSFLIATRVLPSAEIDGSQEDSSVILLRVMDSAPLPNQSEADRIRSETAQRVTGEEGTFWDAPTIMDGPTANLLSFAGVRCRVIGTFYLEPDLTPGAAQPLRLRFGSDISNYYPNRGLKVYKPTGGALERIVNYRDPLRETGVDSVRIGTVRYASTNRAFQGTAHVPVSIIPEDLLDQKSALFGMTRIGKSNTTKIIAKAVFDLRFLANPRRVGQIIFDPNGEYANENVQDRGALKNVWRRPDNRGDQADVITYGSRMHPNDPGRRLMLLNFYELANLQAGKENIDGVLLGQGSIYVSNFRQVTFGDRPPNRGSAQTRFDRRVLAYRSLLARAGFTPPATMRPVTARLFGVDFIAALRASQSANAGDYQAAANILALPQASWDQVAQAMQYVDAFLHDPRGGYDVFNTQYAAGHGESWADEDLKKILRMYSQANGPRLIGAAIPLHAAGVNTDYAIDIFNDLRAGRLVIVDQSGGDEAVNRSSADRIMEHVFVQNRELFRSAQEPPHVLVYLEEAHNILPAANEDDFANIWVRTAKEGAKYRIGLVYATQEVSSIQRNILKNTSNWFIGHLNNTDETKELVKYYDFEDFEASIRRAQDKGFLRVKTMSNLFVVPVQIDRFLI